MNLEENAFNDGDTIRADSDHDSEHHADQEEPPKRPWACLVAIERSNPDIVLWEDDTIVGRGDVNGNTRVSKFHCRIFKNSSGNIFVNNFDKNGILINGSRLENADSRSLKNGDKISLGLLPGLPQYIFHIRDNRQNVLKNGTVNGRRTNELSKVKDDFKCCICLSLLHDVVTVAPCLHNFCNGCFSACYKNNRTPRFKCPQCRQPIVFAKRNHTLCNIIQGYLEKYPTLKRPAEEITHLDQISIVGSNFVKVGTYDDDSARDDDLYQYCPQCLRSNVTDGAFRCRVGTHHIQCSTCDMLMPDRSDIDVPQKCAGCCRAFCGLYWNSQSIIRSFNSSCIMKKMDEQIIIDFPMGAFQGNAYEQDVTKRYLEEYGISIHDIVQADFGKMCMGVIGKPESLGGLFTTESYFCEHCIEIIIAHLLYEFRLSIPRKELPPDAAGRENCWYGRLCRTQRHNTLHTQKYNHACEPRPRDDH